MPFLFPRIESWSWRSSIEGVAINCKCISAISPSVVYSIWLLVTNRCSFEIIQGIDQIRPGLGAQVQKPFLQSANQFQLLPQQQQQVLAQVQAQGNIGNSPVYGDVDPRRFSALPRGPLNAKDGQPTANDGSIGSPMQSTSSKVKFSTVASQDLIIASECM